MVNSVRRLKKKKMVHARFHLGEERNEERKERKKKEWRYAAMTNLIKTSLGETDCKETPYHSVLVLSTCMVT